VVIATHRRLEMLRRTLDSLAAAEWPEEFVQAVVVENGPAIGAADVCAQFPAIPLTHIHQPAAGLSMARNTGLRSLRADVSFVVFFDDDVFVEPNALRSYMASFQEYGESRFYGGPVFPDYEGGGPPEWLLKHLPLSVVGLKFDDLDHDVSKPAFLGANLAVSRRLLQEEGAFDPWSASGANAGPVGEETRLQERLLARGVSGRVVTGAAVWHRIPAENCTPAWALQRRYRHGYTDGLVQSAAGTRSLRPWMLRRVVGNWLRLRSAQLRGQQDEEELFRLGVKYNYMRGYLYGLLRGRKAQGDNVKAFR